MKTQPQSHPEAAANAIDFSSILDSLNTAKTQLATRGADVPAETILEDEPLPDDYDRTDAHDPDTEAIRRHPALSGKYHIVRLLGRGAQGSTWMAVSLALNKYVALKALGFDELTDWKSTEMFQREIGTLQSMNIPGTPRYIEAIDASQYDPAYYFLAQTLIPGETLDTMLARGHVFKPDDITEIALKILKILGCLRSFVPPIVHRDIKPSNLMRTPNGSIYLIDFGASMLHEPALGGTTVAGTAGYMSPEQCVGCSGPESDIYSLGATLVHLLTGVPPWQIPITSAMKLQFHSYLPPATNPLLVQLLDAMLDPMPSKRLNNLAKMTRLLQESDDTTHARLAAERRREEMEHVPKTPDSSKHPALPPKKDLFWFTVYLPPPLFKRSWMLHLIWFISLAGCWLYGTTTENGFSRTQVSVLCISVLLINILIYVAAVWIYYRMMREYNDAIKSQKKQEQIEKEYREKARMEK